SLSELEPRLFSFNNPAGACPTCDGLGVRQFFDPEKILQHPEATLASGAIKGWDRRAVYYFQMLTSVAEHYGIDLETPWEQLPEAFQTDRKSTRLNSSHVKISYAVFCLKKKKKK